ncbi:MAG: glycosyltransferase, partial [Methanosarcina sp.]
LSIEHDQLNPDIVLYVANHARSRDRYRHEGMDSAFAGVLEKELPDVVHIGHLNHLSTGIPETAARFGAVVVFTIHDFWLACPRGQFLQMGLGEEEVWKLCPGQENRRCAVHCMSRIWGGIPENREEDIEQWVRWVDHRMKEIRNQVGYIDFFIAPSMHIRERLIRELDLDPEKVIFEPYGFDLSRLSRRKRVPEEGVCFGYIGRIAPAKGVDLLIKAFGKTKGNARLKIWGRETADVKYLKKMVEQLPEDRKNKVQWMPEYQNEEIVPMVFNHVDAIVVPSIWDENSPLVIHEAQQVKVPVLTADHAGMRELVKHEENGLLFKHRNADDMARVLQQAIDKTEALKKMGERGYLYSQDGSIPSVEEHVKNLISLFESAIKEKSMERSRNV